MNKYLLTLALICSSQSQAFPAYKIVNCKGNVNGHRTSLEFNRGSHILSMSVDGDQGAIYANETGNRIYTNPEYDEYGNRLVGEILSNSINWNATFNIYVNSQLAISGSVSCQRVGIKTISESKSITSIMSLLRTSN